MSSPDIPDDADDRIAAALARKVVPQACEIDAPIDPERIRSICAEYLPRLTAEHRTARGWAKKRLASRIRSLHALLDFAQDRDRD